MRCHAIRQFLLLFFFYPCPSSLYFPPSPPLPSLLLPSPPPLTSLVCRHSSFLSSFWFWFFSFPLRYGGTIFDRLLQSCKGLCSVRRGGDLCLVPCSLLSHCSLGHCSLGHCSSLDHRSLVCCSLLDSFCVASSILILPPLPPPPLCLHLPLHFLLLLLPLILLSCLLPPSLYSSFSSSSLIPSV